MRAQLIDDKLTPLTAPEVARAFSLAYVEVFAAPPTVRTLAILMAQSALESGRWKSLHCWNLTNIKASENYEGYYCLYKCDEIIDGKRRVFEPPHPQCRFRAFPSLEEASLDYLRFLTRARYLPALKQAQAGDPRAFVAALKVGNFFTAAEEPYAKAVMSLTTEYERQIPAWLADVPPESKPPIAPELSDEDLARVASQQFDHLDLDGDGFIDREKDTDPTDLGTAKTDPPPPETA